MIDEKYEDSLLAQVSGERLIRNTGEIARWVRLSGEPDELESFQWVEKELVAYGYRTELTSHEAFISLPGRARLTVDGTDIDCITHAFASSTPSKGISGELVYARPGTDPGSLRGKVALVDGMASGVSAVKYAQAGTLAQVHVQDDHLHETSVSPVWGNPTDMTIDRIPSVPSVSIRQEDGRRLKEALDAGPVSVKLVTEVLTEWRQIPLLLAELPDIRAKEFLLLSSHIDSWHYGAMDNGSANATTLEVARLLFERRRSLRRGLRIAFWSGHSHGRFAGSAWYADRYWQELYDNCVGHVFVDSTGGKDAVIVTEPPVMPQTHDLAAAVVAKVTGEKFVGKRIGRFADQSFYGVGLNSTFGTLSEQDAEKNRGTVSFKTGGKRAGGLGWWWHTEHDTIDKVDEMNLVRDTRIYLAAVYRLLSAPLLPYDYRRAADELVEVVGELDGIVSARLDLSQVLESARALQDRLAALYQVLATVADGDERADLANLVLLRLSRHLVPIAFHENEPFDHDPMEPLKPVPALQPARELAALRTDDAGYFPLLTRLQRKRNWIRSELESASRLVDGALESLRPEGVQAAATGR
jgi:hypothetical protein